MTLCNYCGAEDSLPFTCKFCKGVFCSEHRLPESHVCPGLQEYQIKRRAEGGKIMYRKTLRVDEPRRRKEHSFSFLQHPFRSAVLPIIAINVVVFLLVRFVSPDPFLLRYSTFFSEPWTIITSMFLQIGFFHLLFNMFVLYQFGLLLERAIGVRNFLFLYFSSGIVAGLAYIFYVYLATFVFSHPIMTGQTVASNLVVGALGASGAVLGVFAAVVYFVPRLPVLFFGIIPLPIWQSLFVFLFLDIFVFSNFIPIANSAHIGGIIAGYVVARLLYPSKRVALQKIY